ncbi:MAG: YqeG family HAD IIIA-type phosphatase [Oscillospiraceae bacterium]|nr:YqeG family HAD IIIA-type phosphatase [Oscillospiraceae bacterium]
MNKPKRPRFSLIPQYLFRDITDVSAEFLDKLGVKFLMLDLDNTLAAYDEHVLSDNIVQWLDDIRNSGIELFIISNSTRKKRVGPMCDSVGIKYIMQAFKPSPKSLLDAMKAEGYSREVSALAGDQIVTDGIAANKAGVFSIVIRPRHFSNPFLAIRYAFEVPLRALCKNKFKVK